MRYNDIGNFTIKKTISFLIAALLLMSSLTISTSADAAASNLIFDLDLSNVNVSPGTALAAADVSNAVSGNDTTFGVGGTIRTGSLTNAQGGTTKYLSFGTDTTVTNPYWSTLNVTDESFSGQDELTIESWARIPDLVANTSGTLFKMLYGATPNNNTVSYSMGYYGPSWFSIGQLSATELRSGSIAAYENEWLHIVTTRKWNNPGVTTGTWTTTTYINGVKIDALSTTTAEVTRQEIEKLIFVGGGGTYSNGAFKGDISTFKVYDEILTETDARNAYDASLMYYQEAEEGGVGEDDETSNLIFDLDLSEVTVSADTALAAADVSNAVAGNDTVFGIGGTIRTGSLTNAQGETTKYLSFGTDTTVTNPYWSTLNVTDESFSGQDELTIESWARIPDLVANTGGSLFKVLYGATPKNNTVSYSMGYYGPSFFNLNLLGQAELKSGSIAGYENEWLHIVTTRKWNNPGATTGTWTTTTYINGVKIDALSVTTAEVTRQEIEKLIFVGGGGTYNNGAFKGDISDFKVYDTILSAEDVAAEYNKSVENFVTDSGSMCITTITPEDCLLSPEQGEISIKFDNYVDADTISGITLQKQNGGFVNIGIESGGVYSKTVTVTYSGLEEGILYILSVPATVKSLSQVALSNPGEYTFTTTSNLLFYEDFEGDEFIPETQCPAIEGLRVMSSNEKDSWKSFMVHTDSATGKKYVDFVAEKVYDANNQETGSNTYLYYNLPTLATSNAIAFEMKFRASVRGETGNSGSGGYRQLLRPYSSANLGGTSREFVYANSQGGAGMVGGNDEKDETGEAKTFTTVAGVDDWHILRMVTGIQKDGKRYFDYYYDANDPSVFCRVTDTKYNPANIGSMLLAKMYLAAGASGFNSIGTSIDYIKIYKVFYPQATTCDIKDTTVEISFTDAMRESSFANGELYYQTADGRKVETAFVSYDVINQVAKLKLMNHFLFGKTYQLYTKGIGSEAGYALDNDEALMVTIPDYDVVASHPVYKDKIGGTTVTLLNQAEQITTSFTITNNAAIAKSIQVIFQHCDASGRVKSMIKHEGTVNANGGTMPVVSADISSADFQNGDYVRIYIWDVDAENGVKKAVWIDNEQIDYE